MSGAGNRYDYWRVAWQAWQDTPVTGVGAGNFDRRYFAERAVTEDVRQPHSIELQLLSELGVVGLALLLVVIGAVVWGARTACRLARGGGAARTIAAAALGTTTAWLVHTSVDWLHLLPGITAIAVIGMVCLVTLGPEPRRRRTVVLPVAVALVLTVAAVSLTRQAMTERFVDGARDALPTDPAVALRDADRALRLDPELMSAYYVKAAALARFGEGDAARATLRAARREGARRVRHVGADRRPRRPPGRHRGRPGGVPGGAATQPARAVAAAADRRPAARAVGGLTGAA